MICPACKNQIHEKCKGGTWCDCGKCAKEAGAAAVAADKGLSEVMLMAWDWKEAVDLDKLSQTVNKMDTVFLYPYYPGTGTYGFLIVSPLELSDQGIEFVYQQQWGVNADDD